MVLMSRSLNTLRKVKWVQHQAMPDDASYNNFKRLSLLYFVSERFSTKILDAVSEPSHIGQVKSLPKTAVVVRPLIPAVVGLLPKMWGLAFPNWYPYC